MRKPAETHEVFDHTDFFRKLHADMESARHLVLLHSPYVTSRQLKNIGPQIRNCCSRGVRICVFIQQSRGWERNPNAPEHKAFNEAINSLRSFGAHVTIRMKNHEKVYVIDDRILWDGSLNALSYYDTSERMTRWISSSKVQQAINMHRLNSCSRCLERPTHKLFVPDVPVQELQKILGGLLKDERLRQGYTQAEVAEFSGLNKRVVAMLEHGERNMELKTLTAICDALGMTPLIVPKHFIPALSDSIQRGHIG